MKTNLYYRDVEGELRSMSYGNTKVDIDSVNNQEELISDIMSLEALTNPNSPVLCCIEN